ncbi:hypothetical protein [Glaciecola sp. SC05]|uniref:hypothetical protein n=1 Tax=Glaciecola sp. SC05 TaxID=1987355 RepID=UPI003527170C
MIDRNELTQDEIELVSSGSVSNDARYGGALASSIFFTGLLFVPGIRTSVALAAFGASLFSSGIAMSIAGK